jgi:lysophospholipase L1-like esterase
VKKLFVIGDSISMHYGPYLEELCKDSYQYSRKSGDEGYANLDIPDGANNGDSTMVLHYLMFQHENQLIDYDVLLLNCGLHDIKTSIEGHKQVEPDLYEKNLKQSLSLLKQYPVTLIWVTTTPADETVHNAKCTGFKRYDRDILHYNKIADKVMREADIRIIDLYSFTLPFIPAAYIDHIHFNHELRKKQAAYIFEKLKEIYE